MEMIVTVFLSGLLWDRGSDRVTSSAWGNPPSIYCATSRVVQSKNHQLMTLGSSSVPPTTTGPSMAIMLPRGLQINQVPPPSTPFKFTINSFLRGREDEETCQHSSQDSLSTNFIFLSFSLSISMPFFITIPH